MISKVRDWECRVCDRGSGMCFAMSGKEIRMVCV